MFRFYFDGNEVQDPLNWDDFEENIVRDETIKGLLPRYDIKLSFNAGGYDYLYSIKKLNGFCNLVSLRVDFKCGDNYETILNGYIPISDCKFNRNKCIVECQVVDDNYGAMIVYLGSTLIGSFDSVGTYTFLFSASIFFVLNKSIILSFSSCKYTIIFIKTNPRLN